MDGQAQAPLQPAGVSPSVPSPARPRAAAIPVAVIPGTPLAEALGAIVASGEGLTRLSDELATVSSDVGRGVQAILAVFEEIDAMVHRLREAGTLPPEAADQLSDRILSAFQACDFQDLTGQRVSTVRRTLKDLERKIALVRDIAKLAPTPEPVAPPRIVSRLENGPRLQSDEGHLTQYEVDRLLA